ncbi:MAG: MFS transporter [Minwuia sp.]|uniref:MFS transporter n=1 Tax=Minwuia sp. TaxID=2493630 RepID=UPI003A83CB6C
MTANGERAATPRILPLLMLLFAIGDLSTSLLVPSLPGIAREFGTPDVTAQLAVSGFAMAFGLGQLLMGPLSDAFGRRPVLIGGLVLFGTGSVLAALAPGIEALIAGRVVQGAGASAGYVLAPAVVRDVATDDRQTARMMAPLFIASGSIMIFSPLIGEALMPVGGWQAAILAGLLVACIAFVWVVSSFRETLRERVTGGLNPVRMARTYAGLFVHGRYFAYLITHCCAYGASYTFIANAPFIDLANGKGGPLGVGISVGVVMAGFLTGLLIARRLTATVGVPQGAHYFIVASILPVLVQIALHEAGLLHQYTYLALEFLIIALIGGMAPFTAAGVVIEAPGRAGSGAALLGASQMLTAAGVIVIVGFLNDGTMLPLALMQVVLLVIAVAGFRLTYGPMPKSA